MRLRSLVGLGVGLCLFGCAGRQGVAPPTTRVASPAAKASSQAEAWLAKLDREHPLVGKVWDVRAERFLDVVVLAERLAQARFILLGERHDNPDHHRLQARLLAGLLAQGRRPAVVFEMLELEQQPELERYRKNSTATAAGLGEALGWAKTSWPPFAQYLPIFERAFEAKLPIVAGNLAHATARQLVREGLTALPKQTVEALRLDQAFPAALEAPLLDELRASHCGHLPESMLGPMALAQHARDAQMARALLDAGRSDGAVLIAGAGHARRDRAVPYYLGLEAPGLAVLSVALLEVQHGVGDPREYLAEPQGAAAVFDFAWFTPRVSDEDPCLAFKKK